MVKIKYKFTISGGIMVEELKRDSIKKSVECEDVPTECIMSHICYKYAAMVMGGLIEAIDYFAGSQGPRVLVRILSKEIPMQIMEALGVTPDMLKGLSQEQIMEMLPQMIAEKGGPLIKIEKVENDGFRFIMNECHFYPYSKRKGFCNVTAGLMLGFAQFLSGKAMDIEEVTTIAHGGDRCEFIAKPKTLGK